MVRGCCAHRCPEVNGSRSKCSFLKHDLFHIFSTKSSQSRLKGTNSSRARHAYGDAGRDVNIPAFPYDITFFSDLFAKDVAT